MVGEAGFEPTASCSQSRRATGLRHSPDGAIRLANGGVVLRTVAAGRYHRPMPIPARLTVFTIGAHDLPALRAFYRGLGWPERHTSTDEFASFYLDGAILALYPFDELAKDGNVPASDVGTAFRGVTAAINVESKELVDAAIAELRANGVRITKEPRDEVWGGRSAYFADPEGNLWEVVYAPGTFGADGAFTCGRGDDPG